MIENNLVRELSPEEVKTINPYEISYIAMKDGSIIMITEDTITINNKNKTKLNIDNKDKKEQSSPNFNIQGKKFSSRIKKENNIIIKNENINYIENIENNNLNYSFRSSDEIRNNNIKENNNNHYIEKKKYIFYKNNESEIKEINDFNPIKHSRTFSYNITPPKRNSNIYLLKKSETHLIDKDNENNSFRKKYSNNNYNNISIRYSKYSNKSNYNNKIYDINMSPDLNYKKFNSTINYSNSSIKNISLNIQNENISNDSIYEVYKKPKIKEDSSVNDSYTIDKYQNHNVLNDSIFKNKNNIFRSKTPIYTMRDLGKKNPKKNKNKEKLELKKYLSKDNHKYYERKELSAPKKSKSNYIKMQSSNGKTVHVFENK